MGPAWDHRPKRNLASTVIMFIINFRTAYSIHGECSSFGKLRVLSFVSKSICVRTDERTKSLDHGMPVLRNTKFRVIWSEF